MKIGDLVRDEFGSIGMVFKSDRPGFEGQTDLQTVYVRFPRWQGWSVTSAFEIIQGVQC